jgi:uncharacterized membrane protein YeaQ/YmgE (transglycosylase-associated protein family)
MSWIAFLIIGGLAGWLASKFMNKTQGLIMNLIVGIVGAYIGGFLANAVGLAATGFVGELIVATIGAVILLWVLGKLRS